ncbi:DUF397 domain-containing protein [Streptomyces sp. NPDC091281]|uniref:DUF397 domain-containing protein n=1 Tax=Streptomyces sp. NPDC091281 TaxID=3365985 RepID=UPI00382731BF
MTNRYEWFKSSYSNGAQNCLESARVAGVVPVRDSKQTDGPALLFKPDAWNAFLGLVKG